LTMYVIIIALFLSITIKAKMRDNKAGNCRNFVPSLKYYKIITI